MSQIIAGHLQLQDEIEEVRSDLLAAGFPADRISSFYVNPPGQHDMYELGGDHDKSPGAKESGEGLAQGAGTGAAVGAVVGAASTPVTGPLGPVLGGLVGAHLGSLFSFSKLKEAGEPEDGGHNRQRPRKAGMMIAVSVENAAEEERVLGLLERHGAHDIERAQGEIRNGDWRDFNPNSLPHPA
jgi:hypothetical protein